MYYHIQLLCICVAVASSIAELVHDSNLDHAIIDSLAPAMKIYQKYKNFKLKKFEKIPDEWAKKLLACFETFAIAEAKEPNLPDLQNLPSDIDYLCHFLFDYKKAGFNAIYISVVKKGKIVIPDTKSIAKFKEYRFLGTRHNMKLEDFAEIACKAAIGLIRIHLESQGEIGIKHKLLELGLVYDSNAYEMTATSSEYGQGLLVLRSPDSKATKKASLDHEKLQSKETVTSKSKRENLNISQSGTERPNTKENEINSETMPSTEPDTRKESSHTTGSFFPSFFGKKKA